MATESASRRAPRPKPGTHVKVMFGRREAEGVVIRKTITGRYSVEVTVPGADDPLVITYTPDEMRLVG